MSKFQLFEIEVPNTCAECGELQHVYVYSENYDLVRSGQGLCGNCAEIEPEFSEKSNTKRRGRPRKRPQAKEK